MSNSNLTKFPKPPELPATREDFLAERNIKAERTLNDMIEELHLQLYEDPSYKRLLWAVYDEQAVEGSLATDNIMAAEMIRNKAEDDSMVKQEKLHTIAKSLGIVLRRYNKSRKERRLMVAGERVADENGNE